MRLSIQYIQSLKEGSFLAQLHSCFSQLNLIADNFESNRQIVKITVFASCSDNTDYMMKINILNDALAQFEEFQAPFALVSQAPAACGTIMEIWTMDYSGLEHTFSFSRSEQASVLQIECPDFSCLFSTQFSAIPENFNENVHETFRLLDDTLREACFEYNDIVRQWNYIENITLSDVISDKEHLNYQIFNDMRSLFYENSNFKNGYPSATGIGMANGGCTIEVIALKEKKINIVKPVTNSLQVDAHSYSSTVLVGGVIEEVRRVSTPKFERGKFMQFGDDGFLFISGTASIIGEQTVFTEDVGKQTLTTLMNIDHLVSMNNLNTNKISTVTPPRLLN